MQLNAFTRAITGELRTGARKSIRVGARERCFICFDPSGAGGMRDEFHLPNDHSMIWDIHNLYCGFAKMKKGEYREVMAPLGMPEPALPANSDPSEWTQCTFSQMWVGELPDRPAALRRLTVNGVIALNAMSGIYLGLSYRREAQEGLLPVLKIHPFAIVSTAYGDFGSPETLEVIGWVKRDPEIFGPAIVRPPTPIIAAPPPTPRLSKANDDGPLMPPIDAAPATLPPPPANDPLRSFRPAGAGKTPY
jgi:hypothetical protein